MAYAGTNKLGYNGGRYYSFLNRPNLVECNFVVDATNGNGLGIRNLKGSGVQNVFMHTTPNPIVFTATFSIGANLLAVSSTAGLQIGMTITDTTTPGNIAAGTKITGVGATTINISQPTTGNSAGGPGDTMSAVSPPGPGNNGYINPNPAPGYCLIQLANNYNRYAGGFSGFVSQTTGGSLAINGGALTPGVAYVITSVGATTQAAFTISPVPDVGGNLAGTYFLIFDQYGDTYAVYFFVIGVGGAAPNIPGAIPVQVTIAENATAANITTALASRLGLLQPPSVAGVFSYVTTGGGTATVTLTGTYTNPIGPFPGGPQDGTIPTLFTFALTSYGTNTQNWNQVGLPTGITPALGASFIATKAGYAGEGGGSSGLVHVAGNTGIVAFEVVGDPNQSVSPSPQGGSPNVGSWILIQMLSFTSSSVTTLIPTAPPNNSVCGLSFNMEAGSILIAGE